MPYQRWRGLMLMLIFCTVTTTRATNPASDDTYTDSKETEVPVRWLLNSPEPSTIETRNKTESVLDPSPTTGPSPATRAGDLQPGLWTTRPVPLIEDGHLGKRQNVDGGFFDGTEAYPTTAQRPKETVAPKVGRPAESEATVSQYSLIASSMEGVSDSQDAESETERIPPLTKVANTPKAQETGETVTQNPDLVESGGETINRNNSRSDEPKTPAKAKDPLPKKPVSREDTSTGGEEVGIDEDVQSVLDPTKIQGQAGGESINEDPQPDSSNQNLAADSNSSKSRLTGEGDYVEQVPELLATVDQPRRQPTPAQTQKVRAEVDRIAAPTPDPNINEVVIDAEPVAADHVEEATVQQLVASKVLGKSPTAVKPTMVHPGTQTSHPESDTGFHNINGEHVLTGSDETEDLPAQGQGDNRGVRIEVGGAEQIQDGSATPEEIAEIVNVQNGGSNEARQDHFGNEEPVQRDGELQSSPDEYQDELDATAQQEPVQDPGKTLAALPVRPVATTAAQPPMNPRKTQPPSPNQTYNGKLEGDQGEVHAVQNPGKATKVIPAIPTPTSHLDEDMDIEQSGQEEAYPNYITPGNEVSDIPLQQYSPLPTRTGKEPLPTRAAPISTEEYLRDETQGGEQSEIDPYPFNEGLAETPPIPIPNGSVQYSRSSEPPKLQATRSFYNEATVLPETAKLSRYISQALPTASWNPLESIPGPKQPIGEQVAGDSAYYGDSTALEENGGFEATGVPTPPATPVRKPAGTQFPVSNTVLPIYEDGENSYLEAYPAEGEDLSQEPLPVNDGDENDIESDPQQNPPARHPAATRTTSRYGESYLGSKPKQLDVPTVAAKASNTQLPSVTQPVENYIDPTNFNGFNMEPTTAYHGDFPIATTLSEEYIAPDDAFLPTPTAAETDQFDSYMDDPYSLFESYIVMSGIEHGIDRDATETASQTVPLTTLYQYSDPESIGSEMKNSTSNPVNLNEDNSYGPPAQNSSTELDGKPNLTSADYDLSQFDEEWEPALENPCNTEDHKFKLEFWYNSTVCPPFRHLDEETGDCPLFPQGKEIKVGNFSLAGDTVFCQRRTRFIFGKEIPSVSSWCMGPGKCPSWDGSEATGLMYLPGSSDLDSAEWYGLLTDISGRKQKVKTRYYNSTIREWATLETESQRNSRRPVDISRPTEQIVDLETNLSINIAIGRDSIQEGALEDQTPMWTIAPDKVEELKNDQCGYWAFYPLLKESCGVVTNYFEEQGRLGVATFQQELCGRTYRKDTRYDDPPALGKWMFIRINCATGYPFFNRPENRLFYTPNNFTRGMTTAMNRGYARLWTSKLKLTKGEVKSTVYCARDPEVNRPVQYACSQLAQEIGYWRDPSQDFFRDKYLKRYKQLNDGVAEEWFPSSCRIKAVRNKRDPSCNAADSEIQAHALKIVSHCGQQTNYTSIAGRITTVRGDCTIDVIVEAAHLMKDGQTPCSNKANIDRPDCVMAPAPPPEETSTATSASDAEPTGSPLQDPTSGHMGVGSEAQIDQDPITDAPNDLTESSQSHLRKRHPGPKYANGYDPNWETEMKDRLEEEQIQKILATSSTSSQTGSITTTARSPAPTYDKDGGAPRQFETSADPESRFKVSGVRAYTRMTQLSSSNTLTKTSDTGSSTKTKKSHSPVSTTRVSKTSKTAKESSTLSASVTKTSQS